MHQLISFAEPARSPWPGAFRALLPGLPVPARVTTAPLSQTVRDGGGAVRAAGCLAAMARRAAHSPAPDTAGPRCPLLVRRLALKALLRRAGWNRLRDSPPSLAASQCSR